MEFGLQIANHEPPRVRDIAQAAEGLGFDLILFPDHVVMEGPGGQYDPHALAYDHMSMAVVALLRVVPGCVAIDTARMSQYAIDLLPSGKAL